MSGLRGRSAVAADHRSALPQIPGLPWWGAAILAAVLTALGVAYDAASGNQTLGGVFVAGYVLGCVLAVLAVRQSGVFTAVIQPPLILFIAVPTAYFVFHSSTIAGIKDLLINCGYPLIERFPLMFFTSAAVLLIGMARWYLGAAARRTVPVDADAAPLDPASAETATPADTRTPSRRSRRTATERTAAVEEPTRAPRRSSRTPTPEPQRASGAAAGTASRRSRHARPPEAEIIDPPPSRPRRRNAPPVDLPDEPRRRSRSSEARSEAREPREPRERRPLPPLDRRSAYERPERTRRDRQDPFERPERSGRPERPQRRPRVTNEYDPFEPYEPPPTSRPSSGGTHHPVSRVRYRDADDGESRTEHRSRPRPSRHAAPDAWEYDA